MGRLLVMVATAAPMRPIDVLEYICLGALLFVACLVILSALRKGAR